MMLIMMMMMMMTVMLMILRLLIILMMAFTLFQLRQFSENTYLSQVIHMQRSAASFMILYDVVITLCMTGLNSITARLKIQESIF